jgi:shikimate kinase
MLSQRHIALIGFMGAGKTSVARVLARRSESEFVDLDSAIETLAGESVARIFQQAGESYFRELELKTLREALSREDACVIACGGGIITNPEVVPLLRERAMVVYLKVDPEVSLARIDNLQSRPLLSKAGSTDAFYSLAQSREGLYEAVADISIDTNKRNIDEVAEAVIEHMGRDGHGEFFA